MALSKEGLDHCVALLADVRAEIQRLHDTEREIFDRLLDGEESNEEPPHVARDPAAAPKQIALIAVYNQENKLLLGKRLDNGKWTLPGGHLEGNENPADGARRELMEEAALTAHTLSPLTSYKLPSGATLHCFSATATGTPHGQNDPDEECEEWIWADVSNGLEPKYARNLHGPADIRYNLLLSLFHINENAGEELNKSQDDEISRLLQHPDPVERSLALKLQGLGPNHLDAAAADADQSVRASAMLHPGFGEDNVQRLMVGSNHDAKADFLRLLPNSVNEQNLALAFHSSPADLDLHSLVVSHPGLSSDLARVVYQDPSVSTIAKLKLLEHPNTPQDVLSEVLRAGINFGDNPSVMEAATVAVKHSSIPQADLDAVVNQALKSLSGPLNHLACVILEACPVSEQVAGAVLSVARVAPERWEPFVAALCKNPRIDPRHLDSVIASDLWRAAAGSSSLNPAQVNTILERALTTGDKQTLSALMGSPAFGRQHLERMLAPPEAIQKSEQGNLVGENDEIAHDMLGFKAAETPAFEAARFLAGGAEPPLERIRRALHQNDGDIEAAALATYGFEVNDQNRRALAAVRQLNTLKKSEEAYETASEIKAAQPEGEDVAEALRRAYADRFVFQIKLGGRHTKGSLIARDEQGGKTYLLKSGSGKQGPAAGAAQEVASQSAREAAWYHVVEALHMDSWYPRAELIVIDGQEFAALELLPWSFKSLDKLDRQEHGFARKILRPYLDDGTLHMWAALDYILGQTDRHGQNIMSNPQGDVRLIDAGAAFAGNEFDPAHDESTFVPYYLRAWAPPVNFNALAPSEKLRYLPTVNEKVDPSLRNWIYLLDSAAIKKVLDQYGIDAQPTLDRLSKLINAVTTERADSGINRLWVIG